MKLPVNYDKPSTLERKKVREEYIRIQRGRCSYCGELLTDPPRRDIAEKKIHTNLFPPNFFK